MRWMCSELKEDYLDASLSRGVWWEDHLGLETWRVALMVLITISYSLFMLLDHSFLACHVLILIMPYAMFISPMIYMISI